MRQAKRNYILGAGEQLVETVLPPPKAPRKNSPYLPDEARARLSPRASSAVITLRQAPPEALPGGEAVAALTLHPQYLSKSAFPSDLLNDVGLRAIGSKPDHIKPDKVARKSEPRDEATSTLFVAGSIQAFDTFATRLQGSISGFSSKVQEELAAVEDFRAVTPEDRLSPMDSEARHGLLECVLHARSKTLDSTVVRDFAEYARLLGLNIDHDHELFASGLCFLAVSGDEAAIKKLAYFSFLRRIRPMPRMRPLLPTKVARATTGMRIQLPDSDPIDSGIVAAVFDAPLPDDHAMHRWVEEKEYGVTPYTDEDERLHGLCVSSAATFGPLDNVQVGSPVFSIHHHGVLGEDPDNSGYHAALKTIQEQVATNDYPLINLSFGPDEAMLDDDVNAFTAVLDELLSDGKRLAFVAVGNSGDLDDNLQLNRVQPPSDAVNAISVGASDSRQANWQRAYYSCVGPGRLGCRVKPDVVAFGGSLDEPFGCIGPGAQPERYNTAGTSFASPAAMRTAGMVLATMGDQLTITGLRALLLHNSKLENRERREVGHGLVQTDIESLLTSDDHEVKVLFQGNLTAGKYVRHEIPMPPDLQGMVELEATLCYASRVDPDFPASYVQAGIETIFRPNSDKYGVVTHEDGSKQDSQTVKSEPLFNQGGVYGGADERKDAHLWDTVLKATKNKRATSYKNPCIELHYNRRDAGQPSTGTNQPEIPYALVLTIRCKAVNDLYDRVRTRYGANLRVLTPKIEIPVRI